jgi:hypothetical protein
VFKPERHDPDSAARTQTVAQAAIELDIHERTIYRYIREGCPHNKHGRLTYVSCGEIQAWLKSLNRTGKQGNAGGGNSDLLAARVRRETALAEKYEDERDERRKKLMPADEVKRIGCAAFILFKNTMAGLPARLVPQLHGRDGAEQQEIIASEITAALADLSGGLRSLGISIDAAAAN